MFSLNSTSYKQYYLMGSLGRSYNVFTTEQIYKTISYMWPDMQEPYMYISTLSNYRKYTN